MTGDQSFIVLDAAAYRALARSLPTTGDATEESSASVASEAREAGVRLAAAERRRGHQAVASPFTLWALLADVAAGVRESPSRTARESTPADDRRRRRAARARLALAALAAHCARDAGTPGAHPFALAEDPDSALCRTLGIVLPPALGAWSEYLASVAADVAADPTPERARRLASPLAHVAERARSAAEDFADEMQDAVLAAYEGGAAASVDGEFAGAGWDDATDEERQHVLTRPLHPLRASATNATAVASDDVPVGEPLIYALLRHDPLLRAVAAGRARRAHVVAARAAGSSPDAVHAAAASEPTADEAALVAARFPAGAALGRELLRRVIAGELETAGPRARRWLWDLQVAHGLGEALGVTGGEALGTAAAGVAGFETLAAYRARVLR